MSEDGLTLKQSLFVENYLTNGGNGVRAAEMTWGETATKHVKVKRTT